MLDSTTKLGASVLQISKTADVGKWHQDSKNGKGHFLLLNLSNVDYTFDYLSFGDNANQSYFSNLVEFHQSIVLKKNQGILCPHQIIHRGNKVAETTYLLHLNFNDIPKNEDIYTFEEDKIENYNYIDEEQTDFETQG